MCLHACVCAHCFFIFLSSICALFSCVSMAPYFNEQFERHMLLSKGERNSPDLFSLISVNMPFFDAFPRASVTYALHHLAGLIPESSINMTGSAKLKC